MAGGVGDCAGSRLAYFAVLRGHFWPLLLVVLPEERVGRGLDDTGTLGPLGMTPLVAPRRRRHRRHRRHGLGRRAGVIISLVASVLPFQEQWTESQLQIVSLTIRLP